MQKSDSPELDQSISLLQATVYGVGIILGAGIYALIGEAAHVAGNSIWFSFLIAAAIATCSAFSYAELASFYPKSAAEFIYVRRISHSAFLSFFTGYITVLTGLISVSAVALGFATYFKYYFSFNPVLVASILILATAAVNLSGIQNSARVNFLFTLIEAIGLVFVIIIGWRFLGEVDLLSLPRNSLGEVSWLPVVKAAALVFFAYIGFEDIANIAEETRDPSRNVPKAIIYSLVLTTIIYILVSMVAVSVVPSSELASAARFDNVSEGPLALVASTALNSPMGGQIFTIVALCATANTVLVLHIVASRMLFGMARERSLPYILARIHPATKTPTVSIFVSTLICLIFVLTGSLGDVAYLTNVGVFLVFAIVNAMLMIHRYRNRAGIQAGKLSQLKMTVNIGWFPLLPFAGMIFCIAMLLTQFWQPMDVIGFELPIIGVAAIIGLTSIPVYLVCAKI